MSEFNEIQKKLVDNGYIAIYKRYRFLKNLYNRICDYDNTCYYNFSENDLQLLGFLPTLKYNKICDRLVNNRSAKSSNIRKKIQYLLENYENVVFVTLTFDDTCLSSTNSTTRRNYVKRFFNSQNLKYVANIDFGQDDNFSEREHYHAVCSDYVDTSLWKYIINVQRIKGNNSSKKIGKYMNKLVNHAVKSGASSTRLLSSQKFFEKF